jgi:hypothetical protein
MNTKILRIYFLVLFAFTAFYVQAQQKEKPVVAAGGANEGFVDLLNGVDLTGWIPSEGDADLFGITDGALHVYKGKPHGSKEGTGTLRTVKAYSHYVLEFEYKWGEAKFQPRTERARDSGLLIHAHDNVDHVWPASIECQMGDAPMAHGDFVTGDLWVIFPGTRCDMPTAVVQGELTFQEGGKLRSFGKTEKTRNMDDRHADAAVQAEKPHGEWNKLVATVNGDKEATFVLNDELILKVLNMERYVNGSWVPLSQGHIVLQAEYAEVFFRNIRIKELPTN